MQRPTRYEAMARSMLLWLPLCGGVVAVVASPAPTCDASKFLKNMDYHGDGQGIAHGPATDAGDCCSQCATKYAADGCNYFSFDQIMYHADAIPPP